LKDGRIDVESRTGIDMIKEDNPSLPFLGNARVIEKTNTKSEILEELLAHKERVFLICLGFSRNTSDAEDLAQEVYLKAYKNIDTVKDLELSKYWLFKIAKNTCLDFGRKRRPYQLSSPESEIETSESSTPESQMMYREKLRSLKATIQKLPKKQKEVFILREYGDLSYREIADVLRINKGTVMSRLTRARRALMNQIKGE
jgi:RNA polymerase sigma-70 factor (ECF subfamily)